MLAYKYFKDLYYLNSVLACWDETEENPVIPLTKNLEEESSKTEQNLLFRELESKNPRRALASIENNATKKKTTAKKSQMVIDAGQKHFEPTKCGECGEVYNPGNPKDEANHKIEHDKKVNDIIRFGFNKGLEIESDEYDGQIICIKPNSKKSLWDKANEVLEVVESQLGSSGAVRKKEDSRFWLFIQNNRAVGLLLSEVLQRTDVIGECNNLAFTEWSLMLNTLRVHVMKL